MSVCKDLKNTAGSPCSDIIKTARRLILIPEKDSSGDKNEFANVAAVTKAALQAKFDAVNTQDRFYPLPLMENAESVRAESEMFEYNSGRRAKVRDGNKPFIGRFPEEPSITLENLKAWEGQKFGVYIIDKDGNFRYYTDKETGLKVQPIMVEGGSVDFMYVEPTDSEPGYIGVQFDFSQDMDDSRLRVIKYDDLDFDGRDNSDVYGLTDVTITKGSTFSDTTLNFTISTIYELPVSALVSELEFYNVTQSKTLTPDSVTEPTTVGDHVADLTTEENAGNVTTGNSVRITLTKSTYNRDTLTDTVT